jgi:hypothetical protein
MYSSCGGPTEEFMRSAKEPQGERRRRISFNEGKGDVGECGVVTVFAVLVECPNFRA